MEVGCQAGWVRQTNTEPLPRRPLIVSHVQPQVNGLSKVLNIHNGTYVTEVKQQIELF